MFPKHAPCAGHHGPVPTGGLQGGRYSHPISQIRKVNLGEQHFQGHRLVGSKLGFRHRK